MSVYGLVETLPGGITRRHCPTDNCASCRAYRRECDIERLARESLSVALRHAQDAGEEEAWEAATAPGKVLKFGDIELGTFNGWKKRTNVQDVIAGTADSSFYTPSPHSLYRIYEERSRKALYIGMAYKGCVKDRVESHMRGLFLGPGQKIPATALSPIPPGSKSEIARLRHLVAQSGRNIFCQIGEYSSSLPRDAKLLHLFETALQVVERHAAYQADVWTFEEGTMRLHD